MTGEVAARRFAFRLASPATALLLGGLVLALTVTTIPLGILARQNVGSGGATFVMGPVFAVVGCPRGSQDDQGCATAGLPGRSRRGPRSL